MKVGIPKEIKNNENRVGMTPAGVAAMTARGHEVYVQHTAGDGSGFSDDEYVGAGAKIVPTISSRAFNNSCARLWSSSRALSVIFILSTLLSPRLRR